MALPQNQYSVILSRRRRIFALVQTQTLFTLRWRYFWRKSNQNVGVAIRPHPNAAQVWNAPPATNREKLETSYTLFLRTVIFPRFTQAYRHLPAS